MLVLEGRLDGTSAPELEKKIVAAVDRGDARIVLDCAAMDYISSAGLRALLTGARQCQQKEGKLAICGIAPD